MTSSTPLPSREVAGDWAERYKDVISDRSMVRIVEAYASGRLVDREAFNYAAGLHQYSPYECDDDDIGEMFGRMVDALVDHTHDWVKSSRTGRAEGWCRSCDEIGKVEV